MKRVVLLSDSYYGYGAEHMLLWLGNVLKNKGLDVCFVSLYDEARSEEMEPGAFFYSLGMRKEQNFILKYIRYFIVGTFLLIKCLRKKQIECVVTFKENPLCLAILAQLFCGYKHIHSERDDPYNRDTYASKFKMFLYRFVDHIVFQTKGAQDFFCQDIVRRSSIIPNPVIIPVPCWRFENSSKTIACVGRLNIRFKRQDVLIRAFARFAFKYYEWNLAFYGDGEDRMLLEKLVENLNLQSRVFFYGRINNVSERLIKDGIFVLASDTEGMPNALMEAMALGMPVISTDCSPGGARALIDNEINGLLIDRSSDVKLSEAIVKLIEDKDMRIKLGKSARKEMLKYTPDTIFEKWMMFFN